jgi:hypothetical protein
MKSGFRILGLSLFLLSNFNLFAQYNYELKTTEDMMLQFETSPNQLHKSLVVLEEQIDFAQYQRVFDQLKTPSDERKVKVVTALRSLADRSQAAVLPKIISITGLDNSQIQKYWVFNGFELYLNEDQAKEIAELDEVIAIEHIQIMEKYDSEIAATSAPAPNGHEHAHDVIKATELWAMGYSGYGITSYTIDTGVNPNHPSLSASYVGNIPGHEISGWYQGAQGEIPYDCDNEYHGTHVTGTILGLDRLTRDTIGAAFNAHWMGAATVECPSGSSMAAMQFAMDPDDNPSTADAPDVINNSWGQGPGGCPTISWQFTLNNIFTTGVANVWAAGNYGPDSESVGSPAQFLYNELNCFSVGNLNGNSQSFTIAPSSSRGPSICPGSQSLKIKPEVSAPGFNIRSAVGEDSYTEYIGTSMATPQVAGGICLLKEAFPDVTGVDITEAIYLTAIDLGAPGEDNTYGNGLIDLMAAYNYLVDQGNTPFDPSYTNDIVIHNLRVNRFNCDYGVSSEFYVQNTGENNVSSFDYTIEFNGLTLTESWSGDLASGDNVKIESPLVFPDAGSGYFRITVNLTDAVDDRPLNDSAIKYIEVTETNILNAEILADGSACLGSSQSAYLTSDLGIPFELNWYSDFEGDNLYGTGNPLNVELEESTTLYAQPIYSTTVGSDKIENTVESSSPTNKGLVFNASQEFLLKSVEINVLGSGFFNVQLQDASGSVIASKLSPVSLGVQRVVLNFTVPKGNGYKLVSVSTISLGVQEDDVDFPYVLDGVVSIFKSNATAITDQLQKYHYFYDWEVCFSSVCQPIPVDFILDENSNGPSVSFEASSYDLDLQETGEVSFTQTVDTGADFVWDFGNGQTSTDENPTIEYQNTGDYLVTLEAELDACTSVYSKVISVRDGLSTNTADNILDSEIRVYPNPAQFGTVYIESGELEMSQVRLFNLSGMLLHDQQIDNLNNYKIDQGNNPPGIYFIQINTNRGLIVKKIKF